MTTDAQIADLWVRGDPDLESAEKETLIRWAKPDDEAKIHTDERGVGRRLIRHPHSTVEEVSVLRDDGDRYAALEPDEVDSADEVVGVRVRLPIGAVSIPRDPRKDDQHSPVVSERVLADGGERTVEACPDCDSTRSVKKRPARSPPWKCFECGAEFKEPKRRPSKRGDYSPAGAAGVLDEADPEEVP